MTTVVDRPPADTSPDGKKALARAWSSLLFVPVSFFAAFALAGGLYSAVGHDPSTQTPPHWADAVALVPAGIVFVIPCFFAVVYARRAIRASRRTGYIPLAIAAVVVAGYVVLNIV